MTGRTHRKPTAAPLGGRLEATLRGGAPGLARLLVRPSPGAAALLVVTLAAWVATVVCAGGRLLGGAPTPADLHHALLRLGAKSNLLLEEGELWRLLAAVFLHGSLAHLAVGLLLIHVYGKLAETLLGTARFLLLFVLAGLGGSFASYTFVDAQSVGASGAAFGLLGALLALAVRDRGRIPPGRARSTLLLAAAVAAGGSLAFGFLLAGSDDAAHVGGFVAGLLLGIGLPSLSDRLARLGGLLAVVLLLATGGAVIASAAGAPPLGDVRLVWQPLAGGALPVPADWRAGPFVQRRCVLEGGGAAAPGGARCFVDGYDTALLVGPVETVLASNDAFAAAHADLIADCGAAQAGAFERRIPWGEQTLLILSAGGTRAYVIPARHDLVERYRELLRRIRGDLSRSR